MRALRQVDLKDKWVNLCRNHYARVQHIKGASDIHERFSNKRQRCAEPACCSNCSAA